MDNQKIDMANYRVSSCWREGDLGLERWIKGIKSMIFNHTSAVSFVYNE